MGMHTLFTWVIHNRAHTIAHTHTHTHIHMHTRTHVLTHACTHTHTHTPQSYVAHTTRLATPGIATSILLKKPYQCIHQMPHVSVISLKPNYTLECTAELKMTATHSLPVVKSVHIHFTPCRSKRVVNTQNQNLQVARHAPSWWRRLLQ